MSDDRNGPLATVTMSCVGCKHVRTERYAVQGDSGCDVYCTHADAPKGGEIGDTTWRTPNWCPLMHATTKKAPPHE